MKNNKQLVMLSLIAITIIGILSGASYAYFQVQQKQGQETVIESGTMALTLEDGATITADNLIPGEYIEKEFTVKNTGTLKTGYDIYLSEVVNTFVNQSDLVYEIISSNGYNTSNQIQVPNTETKIINNYNINPLEEHKYILKITYKLTNENQNDNMGRTFIAKININEYNQNNSERYIKLYDANNNEIDKQVLTNNSDYYYPLSNINLSNSTNIYCDNGGIPTIENNQLKVSEVTSETNCRISNSINTTITNLPNTKTGIVMTNNQDGMTSMTLTNKEVVLDLNGKTINGVAVDTESTTWNTNHCGFVLNTSTLIVNDTIGTGGIYTGKDGRVFAPVKNSNLIINNGNYSGRQSIQLEEYDSNVLINGGNFFSKLGAVIATTNDSLSNITINDGIFIGTISNGAGFYTISTGGGNLTINGGKIISENGVALNNGINGVVNINGGKFESGSNNTITNNGTLNISGSEITNTSEGSSAMVNNSDSSIINMFGGVINSNTTSINNKNGTLNISDSTIRSQKGAAIHNNDGSVTIDSGSYSSTNGQAIKNNAIGTIYINGGIFESTNSYTLYNNTTGVININQSVNPIYITSLAKDWKPAIYNTTGTININANQADNCTSNSSDTTSGLCIYAEGNKVFDDSKSNVAVRIESNDGVLNINGGTYYGGYESISSYGISKIENANVISPRAAIVNHNIMCVCNTTVNAPKYNLYTRGSKLVYSNVTFLNRAPNITNVGSGTVTEVDTCPIVWPED